MKRRSKRSACAHYESVHTLIGNDVYNHQTDELGAIEDIVMDVQTGRIGFAVLRCHLPSSAGEKRVAVPWYKLQLDTELHCFLLDLTIDRLLAAPALDAPDKAGAAPLSRPNFAPALATALATALHADSVGARCV